MSSKYINLEAKGVEGRVGRKEGWKEEEGEGSLRDKSVPKKRGSHSPPWLEHGQEIIHFKEPDRLNMNRPGKQFL